MCADAIARCSISKASLFARGCEPNSCGSNCVFKRCTELTFSSPRRDKRRLANSSVYSLNVVRNISVLLTPSALSTVSASSFISRKKRLDVETPLNIFYTSRALTDEKIIIIGRRISFRISSSPRIDSGGTGSAISRTAKPLSVSARKYEVSVRWYLTTGSPKNTQLRFPS